MKSSFLKKRNQIYFSLFFLALSSYLYPYSISEECKIFQEEKVSMSKFDGISIGPFVVDASDLMKNEKMITNFA